MTEDSGTYVAHYWRFGCKDKESFDTLDDALTFLAASEERDQLAPHQITGPAEFRLIGNDLDSALQNHGWDAASAAVREHDRPALRRHLRESHHAEADATSDDLVEEHRAAHATGLAHHNHDRAGLRERHEKWRANVKRSVLKNEDAATARTVLHNLVASGYRVIDPDGVDVSESIAREAKP